MSTLEVLPNEITLSLGEVSARVSPQGASLTELIVAGLTVVEHVSAAAAKHSFAGATLAPWPNRLKDGEWVFEGKSYRFTNLDSLQNANHGLVFDRTFAVDNLTKSSVEFLLTLGEDAGYPFRVQFKIGYTLTESGLAASIEATNLGDEVAPLAFGAHPYLAIDDHSAISIQAQTQAINDERKIPIGFEPASKHQNGDGSALRFAGWQVDDCFGELARDREGIATATVTHKSGDTVKLWQDESFKYLMVFAHHRLGELGMQSSGLALEPQTAPANALQSGTDIYMLKPGESKTAKWGISVAKANKEQQ